MRKVTMKARPGSHSLGILLVLGLAASGCGVLRKVPIQLARLPQIERYEQTFLLGEQPDDDFYVTVEWTFEQLLGEKNWQAMKDLYGIGPIADDLRHGRIFVRGMGQFIAYLSPEDHDKFLLQGFGRFFLLRREAPSEIMLAGDFAFVEKEFWISDLDRGTLAVNVDLYLSRIPGQVTYYHKTDLTYLFALDTTAAANRVYSLDYSKSHDVLLNNRKFATMRFLGSGRLDKLFDFRGDPFLRDDYSTKRQ